MSKFTTSFSSNININGKNYNSIDDVPEEFRKFLKDDDKNGMPDFIEDAVRQAKANTAEITQGPGEYTSPVNSTDRPQFSQPSTEPSKLSGFQKKLLIIVGLAALLYLFTLL